MLGCLPVGTIKLDKLPANEPKGYVKFYCQQAKWSIPVVQQCFGCNIYEVTSTGHEVLLGDTGMEGQWGQSGYMYYHKLRVAYKPSTYTFNVVCRGAEGGLTSDRVSLDIHPNKLTPVNIGFEMTGGFPATRYSPGRGYYRMNIVVGSPE